MRKMLVMVTAVVLGSCLAAPVMAADQGSNDQMMIAAKGKGRHHRRAGVKKPGLEDTVRRIVDDAMRERPAGPWNYTAKRMRPPKGNKWRNRWNDLGAQGWELVGQNENVYIFKKPGVVASNSGDHAPKAKPTREYKQTHAKPTKSEAAPSPGRPSRGRQWH